MSDLTPQTRDRKFIASAALIGLIIVAGIFVVVLRLFSDNETETTPSPEPTSSAQAPSSSCGLADGSQTIPRTAPKTEWYLNGTLVTPKNATFGPGKDVAGIHSCFSRSSLGALFAAANAAADIANPKVDKRQFLETRAARTAGYEAALDALDDTSDSDTGGVQFAGFRVDAASAASATVQLVVSPTEGPSAGSFIAITYNLQWTDGDWLVVVPEDGVPVSSVVTSLSGYIEWSGS
jgi:hypothetical protein